MYTTPHLVHYMQLPAEARRNNTIARCALLKDISLEPTDCVEDFLHNVRAQAQALNVAGREDLASK